MPIGSDSSKFSSTSLVALIDLVPLKLKLQFNFCRGPANSRKLTRLNYEALMLLVYV